MASDSKIHQSYTHPPEDLVVDYPELHKQLNQLSAKSKQYWQDGNVPVLKKFVYRLWLLWDRIQGNPLCLSKVVCSMATLCNITQMHLMMCVKYQLTVTSRIAAAYEGLIIRLSKLMKCQHSEFLGKLHILLAILKENQKELLLQLVIKISLLMVLLQSICDGDFDGYDILKECYLFIPHASMENVDLWVIIVELKHYLAPESVNNEKMIYDVYKYLNDGNQMKALSTLNEIRGCSSPHTLDLIKILKGNLHFHEDKPNLALINYSFSAASSSLQIVKLSLLNTCYLFHKYKDDREMDIRSILMKLCNQCLNAPSILIYANGKISQFLQQSEIWKQFSLFSGIRSMELKRYGDVASFLTEKDEDIGVSLTETSLCYLLLMKSLLLSQDYNRCWRMLHKVLKYFNMDADTIVEQSFVKVKLQVFYLACYLSISIHKFHLAEVFGYWCLNLSNILVHTCDLKTWIKSIQRCGCTLICLLYIGKADISRALSWFIDATSIYDVQSSLLTVYTNTLMMLKARQSGCTQLRITLLSSLKTCRSERSPNPVLINEADKLVSILLLS